MTEPKPFATPRLGRSYLLAVEDTEFLLRDEMRGTRFALEYSKAELVLRDWGIRSTVIVFGSARTPSPELVAAQGAAAAQTQAARCERQLAWYQEARRFAGLV
jgi:hypothetical protein